MLVLSAERLEYKSDMRLQAPSQGKLKRFADVVWSFSVDVSGQAVITALLPQLSLE